MDELESKGAAGQKQLEEVLDKKWGGEKDRNVEIARRAMVALGVGADDARELEIILGRFFGLRCAAISSITNFAAGMTGAELSHEETKRLAPIGAAKLERVIRRYLRDRRQA